MPTNAELEHAIVLLEAYIDLCKIEITRLGGVIPNQDVPPPPPPVVRKTIIGISGSTNVDGFARRIFDNGKGISFVPSRPARCPRVHVSWKGTAVPMDAQLIAAFKNLVDGDKVEMEHEHDVDWRKAGGNAAADTALKARIAVKDGFHAAVVRLRDAGKIPKVHTVCTLSSFSFMPANIASIDKFLCKADVLGADLDGDDASVGGYMNYGDPVRLTNIRLIADRKFGGRWTAPEHGWANTKVGERLAHFRQTIPAIAKFGPEEIMVFNSAGFAPVLTSAELVELVAIAKPFNG